MATKAIMRLQQREQDRKDADLRYKQALKNMLI
jgi:hypothetical protein